MPTERKKSKASSRKEVITNNELPTITPDGIPPETVKVRIFHFPKVMKGKLITKDYRGKGKNYINERRKEII